MTIKIEISAHDTYAQRFIGEALTKIADAKEGLISQVKARHEELTTHIGVNEGEELPTPSVQETENVPQPPTIPVQDVESLPQPPVSDDLPQPPPYKRELLYDSMAMDVNGLPWDERIHAGTKTKNQDGTWKARRKPQEMSQEEWDDTQNTIIDELKGLVEEGDVEVFTFDGLMTEIAPHMGNPDFITRSQLVIGSIGLTTLTDLRQNPQLINDFRKGVGL